jgi:hypothetical protein
MRGAEPVKARSDQPFSNRWPVGGAQMTGGLRPAVICAAATFPVGPRTPRPDQLHRAISPDVLVAGQAYRRYSLLGRALVNVVEPLAHELFLTIGDPALCALPARARPA